MPQHKTLCAFTSRGPSTSNIYVLASYLNMLFSSVATLISIVQLSEGSICNFHIKKFSISKIMYLHLNIVGVTLVMSHYE